MSQPAKARLIRAVSTAIVFCLRVMGLEWGRLRGPLVPFPPLQISSADKNRANPVSLVTVSLRLPFYARQLGLTLTRKLGDGRQRQENTQTSAVPFLVLLL